VIGSLLALALYLIGLPLAAEQYRTEALSAIPDLFEQPAGPAAFWTTVSLWPAVEIYNLVAKGEQSNGE
jgi:hypothetical protein